MTKVRIEKDSMGELEVPAAALYGAQTQRAINNFPISGQTLPQPFIQALLTVKIAVARANKQLGELDGAIADSIVAAAQELLAQDYMQHFPIDIYQTGSGTSSNMNANEVLAHLASEKLGQTVSPNDHVNCGQSSNDTIPSSIHVSAALLLQEQLLPALEHLEKTLRNKASTLKNAVKTGRTHLMDAMPVRMEQSVNAWAEQIKQNIEWLKAVQPRLHTLAQGGTAVGSGVNAHEQLSEVFCQELSALTGISFSPAADLFTAISSQDVAVALSGQLKTTAVSLMKVANDLRWMNSGPLAGLGEIALPALQPGSSIMPGKVNPVIPEAVAMVAAQVIGNDAAVAVGGLSGNFELNVMLPMIANNLCESLTILANVSRLLADKVIVGFEVQEQNLTKALAKNPILVTALNPVIGYLKAAEIAKKAYAESRPIIDEAEEHTDIPRAELEKLLDPMKLTGK